MPGTCHRLRIPSLVSNRSSKGTNSSDLEPITPRKERHRVTMMGAARVGKSSIISQFLYEKYLSRYKQTVEDMHRGEYELPDGSCLTLDILDTSGSYQFPAMRALSINISGAFILVYAVDDEETWLEVERLREQVRHCDLFLSNATVTLGQCGIRVTIKKIDLLVAIYKP